MRRFLTRDIPTRRMKADPIRFWKYGTGDLVEVIKGDHRGDRAVVTKVQRKKNRLFLKGINLQKKRIKETAQTQAGYIYKEGPIHYSNVLLIDPTDNRRCRVKWRYLESGKKVRVSTRTNTIIPRPVTYVRPDRKDGPKDTPSAQVLRKTFDELDVVPVLSEDLIERIQLKWSLLAEARAKREEDRIASIKEMASRPMIVPVKKKPVWLTELEEMRKATELLGTQIDSTGGEGEGKAGGGGGGKEDDDEDVGDIDSLLTVNQAAKRKSKTKQ